MSKLKVVSYKCFSWCSQPKLTRTLSLAEQNGPKILKKIALDDISLVTVQYIISCDMTQARDP